MTLIKCRECGNEVSTEATACPKCGAKVKYKKPMSRTAKMLGGLLVVSVIAGMVASNTAVETRKATDAARQAALTPEQKAQEEAAKAKRTAQIQLAAAGALSLKKGMKDPSAFELTSLVLKSEGTGCYEYRAKNSFGAILPGSAVMTSKGKLLLHERDGNAFVKAWNGVCTKDGGEDITKLVNRTILD